MTTPEIDDRDRDDPVVLGTPEGDGDFESDGLPSTGETSAGGQVGPADDSRARLEGRDGASDESELTKVIDEVATGEVQP